MAKTVFDDLEASWAADRQTRSPVRAWEDSPALAGRTPAELVDEAHGGGNRPASEATMRALVRLAPADDLAVSTVLHMLLPAAKRLSQRLALVGDAAERALTVVDVMWERIRTYPCHRPGTVSGNVLADTVHVLTRDRRRARRGSLEQACTPQLLGELVEYLPAPHAEVAAGEELLTLLAEAVRCGGLDRARAQLIGQCRVAAVPTHVLSAQRRVAPQSLRKSRQRAERCFAAAVSVA